jgi:hypothetical protein
MAATACVDTDLTSLFIVVERLEGRRIASKVLSGTPKRQRLVAKPLLLVQPGREGNQQQSKGIQSRAHGVSVTRL